MYFAGLNKGKGSVEGLKNAQNAAETSTIGLTIAQTALNTAINMGIGLAISYAIKGISKLINYQKELIDKSQEAISVFEESRDALTNNKQTIDEISSDYTRLAQGVDSLGRNVSLNTEEYTRYNEIVNQIADMFPQMVQGYTDEGNAIIINKGNVEELTKAYEEQKKAYQDLIITKSADTFAGYKAKVAETPWTESLKGKNGTYAYIEQKKYIDELIKSLEDGEQAFEDFYSNQYIKNSDIYNVLNSTTKTAGIDWGGVMDTDERYEQMKSQMTKLYAYQRQLVSNINAETSKIKPIMSAYMEQSYDYQSLDSDVQDVVKQIVGQFDSEFYTQFDNETDMAAWVTENVINKFKGIDGEKITEAFKNSINLKTKLQNGEISLDDYLSGINEFKTLIDGFDDNTKKSVDLIFNVNSSNGLSTDTLVNNVKEKLQDDFDDKVGELTLDELQIAADLEVSENDLLSWDELIAKIKEAKEQLSNEPDDSIIPTISSSVQQIAAQLEPQFAKLGEAYKEIFTSDGFTLDNVDNSMLENLRQSFAEIESEVGAAFDAAQLNEFFDALTSNYATSEEGAMQVQKAFNNLATEYFYSTETLEQLNAETANAIEKQLEEIGVQNAAEVVSEALTAKTEELLIQKQYLAETSKELSSATSLEQAEYVAAGINAGNYGKSLAILQLNKLLCSETPLNTSADINACYMLTQAAGIAAESVGKLAGLNAAYEKESAAGNTQAALAIADQMETVKTEVQNQFANLSNLKIDFGSIGGGTSGAGSAGREAGDAYLDAFEEELEELEQLKDDGAITEKEYLDSLRSLYEKYFKDKLGYEKEFSKYQRQYLEGYKSLYESALSSISKLMSHQIDGYSDAKDAAVSSLEEEKESRLSVIDAQKEQLEAEEDLIDGQIQAKEKVIDQINDEIDAMKEANAERQRQLDLQKAQYELERMQHQRTILQYSESEGMHYVADTSGVRDAKDAVDDVKFEIEVSQKEKEIQLIEKQINLLEEQKKAIQDQITDLDMQADQIEQYYSRMISETEKYYDSLISNMEKQKSKWEELAEIEEIAQAYSDLDQVFGDMGYSVQDILNGNEQAFEDFKSRYISLLSDINNNSSFSDGLSYAKGVAEENLGSFLDKTQEAGAGIDELASKAGGLCTVAEGMDGLADHLKGINDALTALPEADKINTISDAFANMGEALKSIADALGIGEEDTVGGLVGALTSLSELSLGEIDTDDREGIGIISQFQNLKDAVNNVTNAISGGGSSDSACGDASTSSSPSMSSGANDEDAGGLVGAINSIKTTAEKALGSSSEEDAEDTGSGTIGHFSQLKNAVDKVRKAIGSEDDKDETEGEGTLISALRAQYEAASEVLPKEKGLFDELLASIAACVSELNNVISLLDSIPEIGGGIDPSNSSGSSGVEIAPYAKGTVGNTFAKGTGKYKGLPKNEKNALVSEYGQIEMTVLPNGDTIITDEPTLMNLPKNTVIFNEEQTKKIMNNKVDVSRKAHAEGTTDGKIAMSNNAVIKPYDPDQDNSGFSILYKAWCARYGNIDKNVAEIQRSLSHHVTTEHSQQMNAELNRFVNSSNIMNNNKNIQPVINGDINITCPGITSQEVARQVGAELNNIFNGFHNYTDQMSRTR